MILLLRVDYLLLPAFRVHKPPTMQNAARSRSHCISRQAGSVGALPVATAIDVNFSTTHVYHLMQWVLMQPFHAQPDVLCRPRSKSGSCMINAVI